MIEHYDDETAMHRHPFFNIYKIINYQESKQRHQRKRQTKKLGKQPWKNIFIITIKHKITLMFVIDICNKKEKVRENSPAILFHCYINTKYRALKLIQRWFVL